MSTEILSSLRTELLALREDCATWDTSALRIAFWISPKGDDQLVSFVAIGQPIEDNEDGAIVSSVSNVSLVTGANALTDRAGRLVHHAMDFIPDAPYAAWIKKHQPGQFAFVAYLATGVRSLHVKTSTGGRNYIDNPARICVEAIDWLLSKLPLAKAEGAEKMTSITRDQVFISYSRKDNDENGWLDALLVHLKPLVRNGAVKSWSDQQIKPGSKWHDEIQQALAVTKVAVFLVTPNFLASDFIWEKELKPLLDEADRGNVTVLWIPVRASLVDETPLAKYQAIIDPAKPLANMKAERDQAWVTISRAIRDALLPK